MTNDFVEGMEVLIRCKQYVEFRVKYLEERMEKMDACGKDTRAVQSEVNRLYNVLGYGADI